MKKRAFILLLMALLGMGVLGSSPLECATFQNFSGDSIFFTINDGQSAAPVRFVSRAPGCDLFLTSSGATLLLNRESDASRAKRAVRESVASINANSEPEPVEIESHALKISFLGANEHPTLSGEEKLTWNTNYFRGSDPSQWKTDVPNYAKVRYHDLYPGVDLVYYGQQNRLKYDLVIQPGEDVSKITLSYEGASGLKVNETGDLDRNTAGEGGGEKTLLLPGNRRKKKRSQRKVSYSQGHILRVWIRRGIV